MDGLGRKNEEPKIETQTELSEIPDVSLSAEKIEEIEKEFFGTPPAYLKAGLENWVKACENQAKIGLGFVKDGDKYEKFKSGMSGYAHQQPKDIGAVEKILKESEKIPNNQKLKVQRDYSQEQSDKIDAEFAKLTSDISGPDLYKAGLSFLAGDNLFDNLKVISGSSKAPYYDTFIWWRQLDYDVNRRKLNSAELIALTKAIYKIKKLSQFYVNIREKYGLDKLSDQDEKIEEQLRQEKQEAGEKWWEEFKLANKK